jgi:acyl-CoA synthetase (AMP-forming)/AMP-acid ligase II
MVAATTTRNLSDLLRGLAATHGERAAVVGEQDQLSFAALDQQADRWASALVHAGFGRGSHVGLLAGNGPHWLAVAFGVWRAGATLVPISTFVTARELSEILAHAGANLLVIQPFLRARDLLEPLRHLAPPPGLREIVVLQGEASGRYRSAADLLAVGSTSAMAHGAPQPEDIACILYTSGTTGQPKGVMLSHRAVLATSFSTAERGGLSPSDRLLSTLPLFWVAGLAIRALPTLLSGCALILVETFTIEAVLAALHRHRPTALHLRPPQVGQLLSHAEFQRELLAEVERGGGRTEWYGSALASNARFITGYGMTEAAGYVTALHWDDSPEARRSQLGKPLPGVELRIVEQSGRVVSGGEVGEVRVRGPGMFSGYHKQPPGAGLDPEGFFMTGDLGRIDGRGVFHFVGRSKELLRVKGINVSPVEVETVLSEHASVEAAYVVGLPPGGLEQRLVALIVPKPAARADLEDDLRTRADRELSHYKRPEKYLFIDRKQVPLSGTSKPRRAVLAELAASVLTTSDGDR